MVRLVKLRSLFRFIGCASTVAVLGMTLSAKAVVIVKDNSITDNITALSSFNTTGAEMGGMSIMLNFAGGGSETVAWAATGVDSGAATGTGWTITQSGTTFTNQSWTANFGSLIVESMMFDGRPGLTVFDATQPSPGSEGSSLGKNFLTSFAGPVDDVITATYSRNVMIAANPALSDIYNILDVDFSDIAGGGATGTFTFTQDTDNDIRAVVPIPAALPLFLAALGGLGLVARRRTQPA